MKIPRVLATPYGDAFGVISYRKAIKKAKKRQPKERVSGVSTAQAAALRAWWQAALAQGKLVQDPAARPYWALGGTKEWPDWITAALVAEVAGMKVEGVAAWLERDLGLHSRTKTVRRQIAGQQYSAQYTFFFVGGFRTEGVDT